MNRIPLHLLVKSAGRWGAVTACSTVARRGDAAVSAGARRGDAAVSAGARRFVAKLSAPLDPVRSEATLEELNSELEALFGGVPMGDESVGSGGMPAGAEEPQFEPVPRRQEPSPLPISRTRTTEERTFRMSVKEAMRMNQAFVQQQQRLQGVVSGAMEPAAGDADEEEEEEEQGEVEVSFHPQPHPSGQNQGLSHSQQRPPVKIEQHRQRRAGGEGDGAADGEDGEGGDAALHLHLHFPKGLLATGAGGEGNTRKRVIHLHLHLSPSSSSLPS